MELLKPALIVSIFYLNFVILHIQSHPAFPDLTLHGQKNSTLKPILNVQSRNKVPEYEIVHLRILSKRSADDQDVIRVHLSAFGKDIHLRLQRNDDFNERSKKVKFYKGGLNDTGGVQLTEVIVEDDDPGIPYIDLAQMAAVTIRYGPDGELLMDGVIGDDFLIKPAPADNYPLDYIYDVYFSDDKSDYYVYSTETIAIKGAHIVYRSAMKLKSSYKARSVTRDDIDSDGARRDPKRPLHVWPEVLLLVDYDTYATQLFYGFNDAQIRRYYISFFHGVDLRFKILSDPKISLVLSHIVLFQDRNGTPFLKNNLFPNRDTFNGYDALRDLAVYMYKFEAYYPANDMTLLLTRLDLCTDGFIICNSGTIGLAYHKGACLKLDENKLWMGVAIVEDMLGFDGILTAVHEIGHLLGLNHDGDPIEDQHTSNCNDEDGYIMSSKTSSNQIFRWSECSLEQFRHFISSYRAECLFNQPSFYMSHEGSELPGVMLSLDEQCKRIWGTRANASDGRVCVKLHCREPIFVMPKKRNFLPPAAEGSPCGENRHCRHGECVSKYLTYSQAWNMAPVLDSRKYIFSPTVNTTVRLPITEDCIEDKDEEYCTSYFKTIGEKEACKNSRILEECCYSYTIRC